VARIDLKTNQVDAYIGLGWVDYSQVSVDLNDEDGPVINKKKTGIFNPLEDQKTWWACAWPTASPPGSRARTYIS
jgi:hypothetical protein